MIDTTNMCSHLQKKLFEPEGVYYLIWQVQCDEPMSSESRSQTCLDYAESRQRKTIVNMAYNQCLHLCCSDKAKCCGERAV